jgi:predicted metalloprotease with PDZ domain
MPSLRRILTHAAVAAAVLPSLSGVASFAQKPAIQITADLSDAARKMYHAEVDLPVSEGPVTLTTPKWIPGTHGPNGPVNSITGVVFTINGQPVAWRRDDVDLFQFHLTIPKGVTTLHAHLDCIVTERVTQKIAVLEWEKLLLYPANTPVKEIAIQPSLIVPAGWGVGTALTPVSDGAYPVPAAGATTRFAPTNVEQLEDSPIIAGAYFHEYPLAPEVSPKHFLDVAADDPEDVKLRPVFLAEVNNLVREASAVYASHHYNAYHFLLTLSDIAGGEGLEHGQSSDNGVGEKGYADEKHQLPESDLLSHEFTHSWNGKYRRPAGLYQPDFATPQQGALLWVYEGMTQYLGNVLAARSGLQTPEQYREMLAISAADLDYRVGREWRTTTDTAIASSILRSGSGAWNNWRRSQDYYQEGELLWLDADTLIRSQTEGKKSLDDFQKIFLGKGGNTGPEIVPYTFDELVTDLNQVMPYDWAKFLHDRVDRINSRADLAGIEQGGYRLVYREKPTASQRTLEKATAWMSGNVFWYSVGLRIGPDAKLRDVRWNGPGDKAHLAPGYKILAVNGQIFSTDALKAAIKAAKGTAAPIQLIVQADTAVSTYTIDYHDGERYPALQRIDGSPAYMDEIIKPRTTPEKVAEEKKDEDD